MTALTSPTWSRSAHRIFRPASMTGDPDMFELMRQMHRLLLNLLKLAREVRALAYEWVNLIAARQARYFA